MHTVKTKMNVVDKLKKKIIQVVNLTHPYRKKYLIYPKLIIYNYCGVINF